MLYNNFNIIITSLLESKNKIINRIQSILQLGEAKNISKQAIRLIGNLIMAFKDNNRPKKRYKEMKTTIIAIILATLGLTIANLTKKQHKLEAQIQKNILTIKVDCGHPNKCIEL